MSDAHVGETGEHALADIEPAVVEPTVVEPAVVEPAVVEPTVVEPGPREVVAVETGHGRVRVDHLLVAWSRAPTQMPHADAHAARFVWGLAQPLLGLRLLFGHRELLRRAIWPVLGFLGVCVLVARGEQGLPWYAIYYLTLISAAPLSPVVFSRHYARLASAARQVLELPASEPYLRTPKQIVIEAFVQLLIVGLGIAPLAAIVAGIPLVGPIWAAVLGYLWALHWVVVEALDAAKCSSEHQRELEFADHQPWFVRPAHWRPRGLARLITWPLRRWCALLRRMSLRWRSEIASIERHPTMALGFGLGSALLLAVPLLNLVFRPAIVIAATHVWGRLRESERTQALPSNLA